MSLQIPSKFFVQNVRLCYDNQLPNFDCDATLLDIYRPLPYIYMGQGNTDLVEGSFECFIPAVRGSLLPLRLTNFNIIQLQYRTNFT